ncbi:F-box/kelch-repeat protein At3g06240-like isoform X2 [Rosa rugosa]|uniref:F-box/kelch-repeat protein At3g06240-like isoform X2 n=1 Tax=Rosa rugosa TaxID=74645 RepID=UPI002B40C0D2|nr:F-box/kelch-repeat protein At3g06240-like isoform X2 [Rosa rugosa]
MRPTISGGLCTGQHHGTCKSTLSSRSPETEANLVGNLEISEANRMKLNRCHSAKLMLLDLPLPIVINILSRLPSELVCCIRCMSKDLLNMVDDLSFVALHTRFLIATNAVAQVPRLMSFAALFPSERGGVIADLRPVKFDDSALTTRGKYAINVSTPRRSDCPTYMVDFVFCNLICFRNINNRGQGICFLIDLCRREVLRLPKNDFTKDAKSPLFCDWYGMGFDSITNTLKILHVAKFDAADCMVAQVLVLGKSSWRQISSAPLCYLSAICNLFSPKNVCAYGDMHWLRGDAMVKESEAIISFDFKKEEFCWTPHPKLRSSTEYSRLYMHLHLLTLKGSLALVDTSLSEGMTTNIEIWLMKDYEKKEWTRDYNISIEMFDLRNEFEMLTDVTCDEWEHGIFFKNFENTPAFFLDLRSALMNLVRCERGIRTKIFSYTRSFISLKDYDILVEAEQGIERCKSYVNLIEEEAQGFSLCERHVLRGVSLIQEGLII